MMGNGGTGKWENQRKSEQTVKTLGNPLKMAWLLVSRLRG